MRPKVPIVMPMLVVVLVVIAAYFMARNRHEHHPCTHGESSISGVFKTVHGKRVFVVTHPAHKTGC